MKLRIEDEEILVALPPEEFEKRVRELTGEANAREISPICERIVYWRGDIPMAPRALNTILWMLGYSVAFGIFLYGLYSVGIKVLGLAT